MKKEYRLALSLILVLLVMASVIVGASARFEKMQSVPYPDQRDSSTAAVTWLLKQNQKEDGGFGEGEPKQRVAATLDAMLAMSAAGFSADKTYYNVQNSAVDFLKENTSAINDFAETDGGSNAKVVLALSSANKNAYAFPVHNYVAQLRQQYDDATGSYNNTTPFNQGLSILALVAVAEPLPEKALEWLENLQADDGSWDDGFGTQKNSDATAMAVMALLVGGRETSAESVVAALDFLADSQLDTGGWEYGTGFGENANSTALVIQALSAAGENFYAKNGDWAKGSASPLMALLSWQNTTGAFQADFGQGRSDNFFATVQAVPATTGKPYPLPSRYEAAQAGVACLSRLQDKESGGWEQFAGVGVSAGGTARAVEAIAATGGDPQSAKWTPGQNNAVKALENDVDDYLAGYKGGRAGIVAQGVVAAGNPHDVTDFAGHNLPKLINSFLNENGEYDDTTFGVSSHSEAMLGLLIAGVEPDESAVDFLVDAQTDGDWETADQNGIALNVLGRMDKTVPKAVDNLKSTQLPDGGWGFSPSPSNPSSTSEGVQGLVQQGEFPFLPEWSQVRDGIVRNSADVIMAQQQENGCWPNYDASLDDPFSTTDAIIMLDQLLVFEPLHTQSLPIISSP